MGNREFDARMTRWMNDHPAPCRRCKERSKTCHGNCEKFKAWTKEKNKARDAEYEKSHPAESAYEKDKINRLRARKIAKA